MEPGGVAFDPRTNRRFVEGIDFTAPITGQHGRQMLPIGEDRLGEGARRIHAIVLAREPSLGLGPRLADFEALVPHKEGVDRL